jgi:branched-subunit amino acid transport protein
MTPQTGESNRTFSKIFIVSAAIFMIIYGAHAGMYSMEGAKYLAAGVAAGALLSYTRIKGWMFIPAVMIGNVIMAGLINSFSALV